MNTGTIVVAVGVLAIAGYFIYQATSESSDCDTGTWTDYLPNCWFSGVTSEINTVLIIVALVVVLVVGLLAFGPQTGHLAKAGGAFLA
jgi:hypothetical protein